LRNVHIMKNIWVWVVVLGLNFFNLPAVLADSEGYTIENITSRAISPSTAMGNAEMQVSGHKVYYLWHQFDGTYWQMWMAVSDLDGSNFAAALLTTGNVNTLYGQFEVEGEKIYYVYGRLIGRWEIHTATSDLDGSNFVPVQQTFNDGFRNYYGYQLDVHENNIYYTFVCDYPSYPIYTAVADRNGGNWSATIKVASSGQWDRGPQLIVSESKIYYVWQVSDGSSDQIWTSVSDLNGSNFVTTKRTTTAGHKYGNQFVIDGTKLYYAWVESDGANYQIWTASMNTDDSGWMPTKLTNIPYDSVGPRIMVNRSKLYYLYTTSDGTNFQVWLGNANFDGTGFLTEQKTFSAFSKRYVSLWVDETNIHYLWDELHTPNRQIMWANGHYQIIQDESTTVTASVPSTLTFTVAGVSSGNACANSGGSASVTTTASTIPFGTYTGAQTKIACQTLTISTNATSGYAVTVQQNQDLTSANADVMDKFSGTYGSPTIWSMPPGSGTESYFGFTTDDNDYVDFQVNKYGSFGTNDTPYNMVVETDPAVDEVNVVSYQLEVTDLQESGVYTNNIMYIATAIY